MIPNLRLTDQIEPEANGQADEQASPGTHLFIDPQAFEPIIRQIVAETIVAVCYRQDEKDDGPSLWNWADISQATRMSEKTRKGIVQHPGG